MRTFDIEHSLYLTADKLADVDIDSEWLSDNILLVVVTKGDTTITRRLENTYDEFKSLDSWMRAA